MAVTVAMVGGAMTRVGAWYRALEKPLLNPPDWLFAPAWTLIYALAVIAAVKGWVGITDNRARARMLGLFAANAVLNVLWSALFFTFQRPDWALAEVITLWLSVLALIVFFWSRVRVSSLLLLPYLLWVGFATWLNARIVMLNGPF